MDLNKLKYFYEVALTGNYLSAGKKLGKTSAAIGTSVRELEKELGCAFFKRTYRGLKKISIDSTMGEYKLATAGVGIACLCDELSFLKDSNLVPVLNGFGPIEVETYFVFHESVRGNRIVTSLLNEIKAHA
jgi:DNA-binding transcriptional LysR family regulator